MHLLRINADWARQIAVLRDAVTEDTHLIRFDNGFYRICRPGNGRFQVRLLPGDDKDGTASGVQLTLQENDLYVADIDGKPFERYASTLDQLQPDAGGLNGAVRRLPETHGVPRFKLQSLIVFCIAESLRSDHIATAVGQMIQSSTTGLLGVAPTLPTPRLLEQARCWGQASNAVHEALSPEARAIVVKRRTELTPQQRQFSERVDMGRIEAALREPARAVKVLKRPD
ncbi:hypothetical protein [Mitsuaria sp. GD03876]|uniref:hypothetical protein n=1 Tax=Mitsuaria sp. GD03876 TaxID=2975399 RepID=UPI002446B52C|nr:hypothetical protein [Mitsuaria sp. GD03876]MDH0868323.1 hypothetical protein [Mitsuaria sp. GD03876]